MLISDAYRALNATLHDSDPRYGATGSEFAAEIARYARVVGARDLLDYGCGKGRLAQALAALAPTLIVREYDPAIPGKDSPPEPADFVSCTEVMEHIEPDCLDAVLADLARLTRKLGYLTIATQAALKSLPDGRNAHLIQQPLAWWRERLDRHFILHSVSEDRVRFVALVKPRRVSTSADGSAKQRLDEAATLLRQNRPAEAEALCRQVLAGDANEPRGLHLLGMCAMEARRYAEAITLFERSLALRPDQWAVVNCLGVARKVAHDFDAALAAFRRAAALAPRTPVVLANLGALATEMGYLAEGESHLRRAIAIDPEAAEAHYNLALCLLLQGRLVEGFAEHEWRWRRHHVASNWPTLQAPLWDGGELTGKTILVWTEQGFGDAIQFARFLPRLKARGARSVLRCEPILARLLAPLADQVVVMSEALPHFDCHVPLLSLPYRLGIDVADLAVDGPYLQPPTSGGVDIGGGTDRLVGLAWAGRPEHPNDALRSIAVAALAPLIAVPGIRFVSLQLGERAAEARDLAILDLAARLSDFADTAALLARLDLVITVDTAVAHLAGAMGRPVWVMLAQSCDWRWMLGRADTPWYPTMRLFRQPRPGDWDAVVRQVASELARAAPQLRR